eukprot:5365018-Prymnesium_polylepis.1
MSRLVDRRPLSEFGLRLDGAALADGALGLFTGVACIGVFFVIEWRLGWIRPTHAFEVAVDGERWSLNI